MDVRNQQKSARTMNVNIIGHRPCSDFRNVHAPIHKPLKKTNPANPANPAMLASRLAFLLMGLGALALGVIGIVIPGLPTTPFLLLASFCFSRSSSRLEAILLNSRFLGPLISDWRSDGRIRPEVRNVALFSVSLMLAITLQFSTADTVVKGIVLAASMVGVFVICRLPVRTK